MTSVQNLLQRLNGNKLICLLILILFTGQSCLIHKYERDQVSLKYQYSKQQQKSQSDEVAVITGEVHEIVEIELAEEKIIITKPTSEDSVKVVIDTLDLIYPGLIKDSYRIVYILPLHLNDIYEEKFKQKLVSKAAQEFYMGAKLALEDSILKLRINLDVKVIDNTILLDSSELDILGEFEQAKYDLIIGPVLSENTRAVCQYSLRNKTPMISPFNTSAESIKQNPYYISWKQTKSSMIENIVKQLTIRFKGYHILGLFNSQDELNTYKQAISLQSDSMTFSSVNYLVVNNDNWGKASYLAYLKNEKNLVFLPSENIVVINSVVTNLIPRIEKDITLMAPYSWLNMKAVEFYMLEDLKSCFYTEPILDFNDSATHSFIINYRETYRTEPGNYAWDGYQSALFYGHGLLNHGVYFQKELIKKDNFYGIKRRKNNQGLERSELWMFRFEDSVLTRIKE